MRLRISYWTTWGNVSQAVTNRSWAPLAVHAVYVGKAQLLLGHLLLGHSCDICNVGTSGLIVACLLSLATDVTLECNCRLRILHMDPLTCCALKFREERHCQHGGFIAIVACELNLNADIILGEDCSATSFVHTRFANYDELHGSLRDDNASDEAGRPNLTQPACASGPLLLLLA